jgi:hypothetical protein
MNIARLGYAIYVPETSPEIEVLALAGGLSVFTHFRAGIVVTLISTTRSER